MNFGGVLAGILAQHGSEEPVTSAVVAPATIDLDLDNGAGSGGSATCTPTGGLNHVFQWVRASGSTAINAVAANSATTSFSSTGNNQTLQAVFRCDVTAGGETVQSNTVTITAVHTQPLTSASVAPTSVDFTLGNGLGSGGLATCTPAGGDSHVYQWVRVSGDASVGAVSPNSGSTAFSSSGNDQVRQAVFRCDVTDGGITVQSNTVTVTVTHENPLVSASATPATQSIGLSNGFDGGGSATCTPSGGSGHTYQWIRIGGSASIGAQNFNAATTSFFSNGNNELLQAIFRCDVTAGGVTVQSNTITVNVSHS